MLELNSRVGVQPESTSVRGVTVGMIDDLQAAFETLHADVVLLE